MWRFGQGKAHDKDDDGLGEVPHSQRQRNKQIVLLKEKVQGAIEVERDKHYVVKFLVETTTVSLDIFLSSRFPLEPPNIVASPPFLHAWVNSQMLVTGSPLLAQFNPHSDLGRTVQQIITELVEHPPQFQPNGSTGISPAGVVSFSYASSPRPVGETTDFNKPIRPAPPPPLPSQSSSASASHYQLPETLPDISSLSDEELERFLNDEDAVVMINQYISKMEMIKNIQLEMQSLFECNEEQARLNVGYEPTIQEKWTKVQEKLLELQELKSSYDSLYQRQLQVTEKYSKKRVLARLKTFTNETDTDSEILAEEFLEQKKEVGEFVQKYRAERKAFHMRGCKLEMMKYQRVL